MNLLTELYVCSAGIFQDDNKVPQDGVLAQGAMFVIGGGKKNQEAAAETAAKCEAEGGVGSPKKTDAFWPEVSV
jgi:hypothetical protein